MISIGRRVGPEPTYYCLFGRCTTMATLGQAYNAELNVVDDIQDSIMFYIITQHYDISYMYKAADHLHNWQTDKVDVPYNVLRTVLLAANAIPVGGEVEQAGKGAVTAAKNVSKLLEVVEDGARACANSFSFDTPVTTDEGEKPIGELQIGDTVLAYDEETGTTEYDQITATITHIDSSFVDVVVDGELIHTTEHHPFYTLERGWTDAGDLQQGDHIRKADGTYGVVQHVGIVQIAKRMYNLTVQHAHTFFVGKQRWLVHNTICIPAWLNDLLAPGHALDVHLGQSKADLLRRINNTTISASTGFKDSDSAVRGIQDALTANKKPINQWLATGGEAPTIIYDTGQTTGGGFGRNAYGLVVNKYIETSRVRLILRRNSDVPRGFQITTAFPYIDPP